MNMPVPVVGLEVGPQWATDLNNCLSVVDSHTHAAGSGTQITPAGLDISSDLSFNSVNNLIDVRSVRLASQSAVLTLPTDLDCIYVVGADLYYNDGVGNNIRITQSGGLAGTPGSIAGLASPASATYVSGSSTFVWQSNALTPAIMDAASYIFRNLSASSFGVTVGAPLALGADYNLTLPSIPSQLSFMTIDNTGNMSGSINVLGALTTNNLSASAGILGSQLSSSANILGSQLDPAAGIVNSQIANGTITKQKLAASAFGQSSVPVSTYANGVDIVSINISTNSRPVVLMLQEGTPTANASSVVSFSIQVVRGSTPVGYFNCTNVDNAGNFVLHTASLMDTGTGTGTTTYTLKLIISGSNTAFFTGMIFSGYEIS